MTGREGDPHGRLPDHANGLLGQDDGEESPLAVRSDQDGRVGGVPHQKEDAHPPYQNLPGQAAYLKGRRVDPGPGNEYQRTRHIEEKDDADNQPDNPEKDRSLHYHLFG
jgi:hypothetical protein